MPLAEYATRRLGPAVVGLRLLTSADRGGRPDLVITDIIMPEQEGSQTITEMCKAKPDAKIIVISGSRCIGNPDFLKMVRSLGAMDVVSKPLDADELLTIVKNCLAGRAGRSNPGQAA